MSFSIKDELAYFFRCQYYGWKGILTYRTNTALWAATSFFGIATAFITISVIYNVSSGIAGWSYYQMLFLAATGTLVFWAFNYLLNPWNLVQSMQRGGIDIYLTRPFRRITVLLSSNYGNVANISFIGGIILLTYAASHIQFTPWFVIEYVLLLFSGIVTMVLFVLAMTLLAYHTMRNAHSVQGLMNLSRSISTYPLTVYGLIGQLIFTLIFPIGLAYYYPSTSLFGETSHIVFFVLLAITIAIAAISYKGAESLMKKYVSGGG